MTARPVLPSTEYRVSALQMSYFTALHNSARTHRCRRFACTLAGADARLAGERGSVTPSLQGTFTLCHMPVSLALALIAYPSPYEHAGAYGHAEKFQPLGQATRPTARSRRDMEDDETKTEAGHGRLHSRPQGLVDNQRGIP